MKLPLPGTKHRRVLDALLTGETYNLFEAESQLHDRSLHSTVSSLQNFYGIQVSRAYEKIPGYGGKPTRCCRYWIDFHERIRVRGEIEYMRLKSSAVSGSDKTESHTEDAEHEKIVERSRHESSFLKTIAKHAIYGVRAITRF